MVELLGCNFLLMPTSKIPSRTSSLEHGSVPSSANLGGLPVHVHAGGEPRGVDGELDSQPDRLDHGLNPIKSPSHSS